MKKIISILLVSVMMVSALVVSASATKIITDNFNTYDENIWSEDAYGVFDGVCEGYGNAVVHQTQYEHDEDNEAKFLQATTCPIVFTTEAQFLIEEDTNADSPACGLWFADTYLCSQGLADDRNIFSFMYDANNSKFVFLKNTTDVRLNPAELDPDDDKALLGEWEDPRALGQNMDSKKWITIGLKVETGKVTCYVEGQPVIVANGPDVADVGKDPTPILFWNNGAHIMWDNFWIGDLNEYAEAPVTQPTPDTVVTEPATSVIVTELVTEIETKVEKVTDEKGQAVTDENGKEVTEIVTEIVTKYEEHVITGAPSADTHANNGNGNGGAQTGDMAVIVAAVMVVALGSAVVVKKVNEK